MISTTSLRKEDFLADNEPTAEAKLVNRLREIYAWEYKLREWRFAELKHDTHFIPYGIDWRRYYDFYPCDYLF